MCYIKDITVVFLGIKFYGFSWVKAGTGFSGELKKKKKGGDLLSGYDEGHLGFIENSD